MTLTKSELKQLITENKAIRDFLEYHYKNINDNIIRFNKQLNKLNKK